MRAVTSCVDALVAMLRFHKMAADPAQVKHAFSGTVPSTNDMVRYLRGGGLRARSVKSGVPQVVATPLPARFCRKLRSWTGPPHR